LKILINTLYLMKGITGLIIGIAILGAVVLLLGYNSLVTASEAVDSQWAQVESQYQRRFDLIPNLVASVEGAMVQEESVFTAIAEARTRYSGAGTVSEKAAAATEVEGALARLLVVMESYPALRSIENVTNLMTQLEGTENRISVERMRYNDAVQAYNLKTKRIPGAWIAGMFGFEEKSYFEAADGSEAAPQVDLAR
jgi:LemA protein